MRKFALSVIVSLLVLSVFAAATENVVSGTVYKKSDSKVVSGAKITVVCNNNVQKTTSDYDGSYSIFYEEGLCEEGSKVKVTAEKGRLKGKTVETMTDFGLDVELGVGDLAIADVFVTKTGVTKPKLQVTGFVDDYSGEIFVKVNNYGAKSDADLIVTQMETGEQQREDLKLSKNAKLLRVFQFATMNLVPGENVIELFVQAGGVRVTKYISYYN